MNEEELFYRLALVQVSGVGPILGKRLLEYYGTAKAVFEEKGADLLKVNQVGMHLIKNIQDTINLKRAEVDLADIQNKNIKVLHYDGLGYPSLLRENDDCPILLFSSTDFSWENRNVISIIGTRFATARGLEFCKTLIEDLIDFKPVIVSGLAYGIDSCAHTTALALGLDTCAVLGHGLNKVYPAKHAGIAKLIKDQGTLLSEYTFHRKVDRENFLHRNRIVAGLSKATIVIESPYKGGSMSTASFANDYNRDVFAVPGRPDDVSSAGCNLLIRSHKAQLLTSAKDLITALNWDNLATNRKSIQPRLFLDLTDEQQLLYDFLMVNQKVVIDMIANHTSLPIFKLNVLLMELELLGLVRPLPGKYYEAI